MGSGPAYSFSTLFYGITVTMQSLHVAARAWSRLFGPSRFVDLVLYRRRRGTLRCTSSSSPVPNVPTEVWFKIRKYLLQEELVHSERTFLVERLCDEHREPYKDWEAGKDWVQGKGGKGCRKCKETAMEQSEYMRRDDKARRSLLQEFQLALPFDRPTYPNQDGFRDRKRELKGSVILIALPSRLGSSERGRCLVRALYSEHSIVNVDFSLPPNPDDRFYHLVQTFDLHVVDVTAETLAADVVPFPEPHEGGEWERGYSRPKFDQKKLTRDEIKPQWKMWSTCGIFA